VSFGEFQTQLDARFCIRPREYALKPKDGKNASNPAAVDSETVFAAQSIGAVEGLFTREQFVLQRGG
jgi:hypothetical protein